MKKSYLKSLLLISSLMLLLIASTVGVLAYDKSEFDQSYTPDGTMRGLDAFQITSDMGAGWNLGNTLDAKGGETNWGNPKTTKAMIDAIAAAGFKTLRVPITWEGHYVDGNYTIDSSWMERVETVVNYGLANGMYVIINIHHNDLQEKVSTDSSVKASVKKEISTVWTQVANYFKNYGDHLIFEVINEPRDNNDWTGNDSLYAVVNEYNEAGRAAIRATAGNNSKRLIMMPTYCASCDTPKAYAWSREDDSMTAVSIHAYLPFDFAFSATHSEYNESDVTELEAFFTRVNENFIKKGIAVVIGEFGATNNNNLAERTKWAKSYIKMARQFAAQDIPCVIWDNNVYGVGEEMYGLLNRSSCNFVNNGVDYTSYVKAITAAYNGNPEYETASSGEEVFFEGTATSSNWGQAVELPVAILNSAEGGYVKVEYSSSSNPQIIVQRYNGGSVWAQVSPKSVSGGIAYFSCDDIIRAYTSNSASGGTTATIDKILVGDTGAGLTVKKVYVESKAGAHTHTYNGTGTVTVKATATTSGRAVYYCSISGCDAQKVVVLPKTTSSALSKPEITSIIKKTNGINIKYSEVEGATGYYIYRSISGGEWILIKKTTALSYTDTVATGNCVKYQYKVKAFNSSAKSGYSSVKTTYFVMPVTINSVINNSSSVKISWTENSKTGYQIYRSINGAAFTRLKSISNPKTLSISDASAKTAGYKYEYKIRTYILINDVYYYSAYSSVVSTVFVPRTELTSVIKRADAIKLSWERVDCANGYYVYRENGDGVYRYVGKVSKNTTLYYVDTSVSNGVKYNYKVKAYITYGGKNYMSASTAIKSTCFVTAPTIEKITSSTKGITLRWTAADVDGYYVYRMKDGGSFEKIKTIKGGDTCIYTNTVGLEKGVKYSYKLVSYKVVDGSTYSSASGNVVSKTF